MSAESRRGGHLLQWCGLTEICQDLEGRQAAKSLRFFENQILHGIGILLQIVADALARPDREYEGALRERIANESLAARNHGDQAAETAPDWLRNSLP